MKRWIALLLSFVMMISMAGALAEEGGNRSGEEENISTSEAVSGEALPASAGEMEIGSFLPALFEWLGSLNPSEKDIVGQVTWDPDVAIGARLRQENDALELEVDPLGRFQLSPSLLAGEFSGQKFIVDLASLSQLLLSSFSGESTFQQDQELLLPWLQKAYLQILAPCLDIPDVSRDGYTLHFQADSATMKERIIRFLDELMAEETTLRTLMDHYGPYLQMYIPGMYADFDHLKAAWEKERDNGASFLPNFNIEADIQITPSRRGAFGIIVHANVNTLSVSFPLDFEYRTNSNGMEISVQLGRSLYANYMPVQSPFNFSLSVQNSGMLDGMLSFAGNTWQLHLTEEETERGQINVTGRLIVADRSSYSLSDQPVQYQINGTLQEETGAGTLTVDQVYNAGNSNESRRRIIDANVTILRDEITGSVVVGYVLYSFRIGANSQQAFLKVDRHDYGYATSLIDLSILHAGESAQIIRLRTTLIPGMAGRELKIYLNETSAEVKLLELDRPVLRLKAGSFTENDQQIILIEYSNILEDAYAMYYNQAYHLWRLKITPADQIIHVEADFPVSYRKASGTADLILNDAGQLASWNAELTIPGRKETKYTLFSDMRSITCVMPDAKYVLRVAEESSRSLVLLLEKDDTQEVAKLQLALDPAEGLSGEFSLMGDRKGILTLRAEEKTPIQPLDPQGAMLINEAFLREMLRMVTWTPNP